jgi:hypothetical protein
MVALARRRDRRVIPALIEALDSNSVAYLAVEAAELLGAPEVAPALRRLAQSPNWTEEELDAAIRRCDVEEQRVVASKLDKFMEVVEAIRIGVSCFSDRIAVDGGGPNIGYFDGERHLTWSFQELLVRANGDPELAASLVLQDIAKS